MSAHPENLYKAYHAHVYFDADSAAVARTLCEAAGRELDVSVGRFHERIVGPHPCWSCQIAFSRAAFDDVIGWLDAHRGDLTIFIHGRTGDDLADHTDHTSWLGEARALNLAFFDDYTGTD